MRPGSRAADPAAPRRAVPGDGAPSPGKATGSFERRESIHVVDGDRRRTQGGDGDQCQRHSPSLVMLPGMLTYLRMASQFNGLPADAW